MPGLPPSGRKKRGKRPAEREEKLNLTIVMNLVCILIPALLLQQVTDYYQHNVELPSRGGAGPSSNSQAPTNPPFNLKLTLNDDNSFMIVNAKTLSPADGLIAQGPGLLLPPLPNGMPNDLVLQKLLYKEKRNRLHGQSPDAFPDPDQITVSAPGDMDFQRVISALDYVRFKPTTGANEDNDSNQMFSIVTLSPGSVGG